jgi:hypothetical protein
MQVPMHVCSECGHRYDKGGYCAHDGKPVVETDDVLLGTEIGRYRLARLLGEGGMGRVYLAVQPAIGSRVAIKILSDQCARDPELLERFFAEARAVNLIRHESIISVIDIPDAKLTSFEFDPVFPDGRVDLTMPGRDREYTFRSPAASQRPAGVPRNMPVERACMVYVEVGVGEITAAIRSSEDCDARLVRHPRCSFAAVWKQARAAGVPDDVVARIGWLFDEQWFFDVDLEGKGGGVSSFADGCP